MGAQADKLPRDHMIQLKILQDVPLQRCACIIWGGSVGLGLLAAVLLFNRCTRDAVRISEMEQTRSVLDAENTRTEAELARIDNQVKDVVSAIQEEIKRRTGIEMEMAEVVARATKLQGERDRFKDLQEDITQSLNNMEKHYQYMQVHRPLP